VIAFADDGEDLDDHSEENKVNGGRYEAAGDHEEISDVHKDIDEADVGRPTFRDMEIALGNEVIAADEKGSGDEQDREDIQFASADQRHEAGDDQKEE
jgi:hypothetical protein